MIEEEFERLVIEAFKPVHEAVGEALGRLAEKGILGKAYFNAQEGLFLVWVEGPRKK